MKAKKRGALLGSILIFTLSLQAADQASGLGDVLTHPDWYYMPAVTSAMVHGAGAATEFESGRMIDRIWLGAKDIARKVMLGFAVGQVLNYGLRVGLLSDAQSGSQISHADAWRYVPAIAAALDHILPALAGYNPEGLSGSERKKQAVHDVLLNLGIGYAMREHLKNTGKK